MSRALRRRFGQRFLPSPSLSLLCGLASVMVVPIPPIVCSSMMAPHLILIPLFLHCNRPQDRVKFECQTTRHGVWQGGSNKGWRRA